MLDTFVAEGFLTEADDFVRRLTAARKDRLLPALVRLGMEFYRQGNGAKAQEHFAVAVRIDPTFVGVETALGLQREQEGRPDSAVKLYREALRRNPESVSALNNLAWLLATHQDAAIRNGTEALHLAERAAQLTGRKDPAILDTLSAAYAEAGDFSNAKKVALEALTISKSQGRLELTSQIETRITSFENGQPIRRTIVIGVTARIGKPTPAPRAVVRPVSCRLTFPPDPCDLLVKTTARLLHACATRPRRSH